MSLLVEADDQFILYAVWDPTLKRTVLAALSTYATDVDNNDVASALRRPQPLITNNTDEYEVIEWPPQTPDWHLRLRVAMNQTWVELWHGQYNAVLPDGEIVSIEMLESDYDSPYWVHSK